jgi:uncharacterized protein (TIGR02246 family)
MTTLTEDREAIRDLFARYCHAIDTGAARTWAGMFTTDGEFKTGFGDPLVGRDALEAFAAGIAAGTLHHMVLNLAVDVDGDLATCQSSVLVTANGAILTTGRSEDELRRVDGSWQIARRNYVADAR